MAQIQATDLVFYLSGDGTPAGSIGGAITATAVGSAIDNIFDPILLSDTVSGKTICRCIYLKNNHATLNLIDAEMWIHSEPASAKTTIEFARGAANFNGIEDARSNEEDIPAVAWSTASNAGAPLALGTLPAGQHIGIWLKRIVESGTQDPYADSVTLRVSGLTETTPP